MWTITKVLNSSVVLVEDDAGVEAVLLGRGLGYARKAGSPIDEEAVDRVFISRGSDAGVLADLLQQIPDWYLDLTHEIVALANGRLRHDLSQHIYLTLTDHLHFAVQRAREGLEVRNRLAWEMRSFYPDEYALAEEALARLRARVPDVTLPDDEAANIAFHLVNASRGVPDFNALRAVQLIEAVTTIIRYRTPERTEETRLHWARFITHLQFFAERYLSGKLLTSDDDFLFDQIAVRYPEALRTAERVRHYVSSSEQVTLPNEEVAYLALHIQRLTESTQTGE
ncbi:MAG TPA: PRD domain-containing protein [Arachnia sp.]|nr:PRD domain-containing protein [Arachnia sp.]HMT85973.1 PRD domain-containing protein [Arachnia sp.]